MADFLEEGWQTMARQHATSPAKLNEDAQSGSSSILEDFASTVAHELATPLAIIHSAAGAALDRSDGSDAEQHELLEMIRRNSDLAALLLRRLALARDVEAEDVTLTRTAIDLATLVTQSVADLQAVGLNGHAVTVTGTEQVPMHADETALREVVFNLLSNAAKYSDPAAPIEVCVGIEYGFARVVVRDHGSGVTLGDTERIFDKFHQLNETSPGAGLGLFISRGLARAHGGDLAIHPARDRGSEFRLTIPLVTP